MAFRLLAVRVHDMDTWTILPLLLLLLSLIANVLSQNQYEDEYKRRINTLRRKRQSGYSYDKPKISFDLPSKAVETTKPRPVVNGIPMQMYYAYPVPSPKVNSNFDDTGTSDYRNQNGERTSNNRATDTESLTNVKLLNSKAEAENTPVNVAMRNAGNTGYSNAISTAGVSEGSGYNYNAGQPSKDSGISPSSTGPVTNVGVTVSDPTGYNYEGQNMVSSQATLNTGYSTPASVENNSGYNYERQNTAQVINYNVNTETQTPTIPSTNSGYAYENQNNAKVRENKDTANIGSLNNENPGYNYPTGKGTTQTSQIKANASFGTNPTEILSKTGYNYERRILMNSNSETDFEPTYSSGSNNKNDDLTSINSQRQSQGPKYNSQSLPSTNYLPTSENVYKLPESYLPVKPTSKVQTSRPIPQSTVTRAPLKKSYLTPNTMDIPKESTTHMTSGDIQNIQTTNEYIPPSMLEPIPKPSLQYLTPNKNQKSEQSNLEYLPPNSQNSEKQPSTEVQTNAHQYLPPASPVTSTVPPPAFTYLPPVF